MRCDWLHCNCRRCNWLYWSYCNCRHCNWLYCNYLRVTIDHIAIGGWCSIGHGLTVHEPFTTFEQWKASRHRSLWLV